jgi:predicted O-linked N-acetylglucosamine transferase (SPINDLY family)
MTPVAEIFDSAFRYHQAGEIDWAEQLYRQILEADPYHADAWHLLGEIAIRRRDFARAIECISYAIHLSGAFAPFHINLGVAYEESERLDEAVASYERALALQPDSADAYNNMGVALRKQGKLTEASASYRQALFINPHFAMAHNNLGVAFQDEGKLHEAEACYRQAIAISPAYCDPHNHLGNILSAQGNVAEAEGCYREALRIQPDNAETLNNLAMLLGSTGNVAEAIECLEAAVRVKPYFAEAHNNLGAMLTKVGNIFQGQIHYQRALELRPTYSEAHYNLGNALLDQARPGEAIKSFQRALELRPDTQSARGNYLMCLNYLPDVDPDFVLAEHRRWAPPVPFAAAHGPRRRAGDRLRIGYVSPGLREHVLAGFLEPIFANHESDRFQVVGYAEIADGDEVTARLRGYSHGWRQTWGASDDQVADWVRADGIDILVDVAGHTSGNRLGVFALKSAPVQITYLGYPNTTGLSTIDYRLTDAVTDPPEEPGRYTEKLYRLPGCFSCFLAHHNSPEVTPLPALKRPQVTFGSLHKLPKLNDGVLDLWCDILRAIPSSRLLVCGQTLQGEMKDYFAQLFAVRGISEARVELRQIALPDRTYHLNAYADIDIALDPFPWSGHATACESLWMGVPVITLYGANHAGRMVASVLKCLGLDDWIADSPARYCELAVQWAGRVDQLAHLRSHLRDMMLKSKLCDGKSFTRNLEQAYRTIWEQYGRSIAAEPSRNS